VIVIKTGSNANDNLSGQSADDVLTGLGGNDILTGNGGHDTIDGGSGNDSIFGGPGNDSLVGDVGNDSIEGAEGNDSLIGGTGNDMLLAGDNNDIVSGGSGNDSILGGDGSDSINAGTGNDTIRGGDGNDFIDPSDGNDFISGDNGDDRIGLSEGNDTIQGGLGNDIFTLIENSGSDIINDFDVGLDRFDFLSKIESGSAKLAASGPNDTLVTFGELGTVVLKGIKSDSWSNILDVKGKAIYTTPILDDYSADRTTKGSVTIGGTSSGRIEAAGDRDWFSIDVVAGNRYSFTLSGSGNPALDSPMLELLNSAGSRIAFGSDAGGSGNTISYIAMQSARLYLSASAGNGTNTGKYQLSAILGNDDIAQNTSTTASIGADKVVSGTIDYIGDDDWYAVTLSPGTYRVSLLGTGGDATGTTLIDPMLVLRDANGALIRVNDDDGYGLDGSLLYKVDRYGEYFISVQSSAEAAKLTGTYRLSVVTSHDEGQIGGTPSDPYYSKQWHLSGEFGINAPDVWLNYTGKGIQVAVLDSGIEQIHPDLDDNLRLDLYDGPVGGAPRGDDDNHGTSVAGVIAAERNNIGGVGVAYNADLISYYTPSGARDYGAAIRAAIPAVEIINHSQGSKRFDGNANSAFESDLFKGSLKPIGDALAALVAQGRDGKGAIFVQGAGNSGLYGDDTNLHGFQNTRYAVTVAATDQSGNAYASGTRGASILISAPGVGVLTTDRVGDRGYSTSGDASAKDMVKISGTSFSAPVVSGVVALMLEANPNLGYRDVQEILAVSAEKVSNNDSSWKLNGSTAWNGGAMHYSSTFGYGLVDAKAAVRLAETWKGLQTAANEAVVEGKSGEGSVAIPDAGKGKVVQKITLSKNLLVDWVEVDVKITHERIGDLEIILISPSGTSAVLLNRPGVTSERSEGSTQDNIDFTFSAAGMLGEAAKSGSSGKDFWQLVITDKNGGFTGTLDSWALRAYGNSSTEDNTYIFTDEFGALVATDSARGTIKDSDRGYDIFNAAALDSKVIFDLGAGTGLVDGASITFTGNSIERAVGGSGNDKLTASAVGGELLGARGNDELKGGIGADTLRGGDGDDKLTGGGGNDKIEGGAGIDTIYFSQEKSLYSISRGNNGTLITGPEGSDEVFSAEILVFGNKAFFTNDVQATMFSEQQYLALHTDVEAAVNRGEITSGLQHWLKFGRAEGRSPSLLFDTTYYLLKNTDVADAVRRGATNALDHFMLYGMAEGREASPYFKAASYLTNNPDVKNAGMSAVSHYLTYGLQEGRLVDLDWEYLG
jgi:subtilisin-like proprotein convertase family protein